jgi:hypothetical protein
MKIIASIPQKYGHPRFVIEASTEEVAAICLNPSPYPQVKVTDKDGKILARECKELQPCDEVSPDASKAVHESVSAFLSSRSEIESAMKTLRGAMTKLSNLTFETP